MQGTQLCITTIVYHALVLLLKPGWKCHQIVEQHLGLKSRRIAVHRSRFRINGVPKPYECNRLARAEANAKLSSLSNGSLYPKLQMFVSTMHGKCYT